MNTEPTQDQRITNGEPIRPEAAPVGHFASNEDVTNAEPIQDQDTTNRHSGRFTPEDPSSLEIVPDLPIFVETREVMCPEPMYDQCITNAEPTQPEAAPVGDFANNEDVTSAELMHNEHNVDTIFLDLDDDSEPFEAIRTAPCMGIRRPPLPTSEPSAPAVSDDDRVEARAQEMAVATWDGVDAKTFEVCQGQYNQFWTYRKKHFLELAAQELTSETM